jgi:peptide/nickel transport system substrate-binding protein
MTRVKFHTRKAGAALALIAAAALVLTGCSGTSKTADSDHLLTISRETGATFVRNFNPFSPNNSPITNEAVYEPLLIANDVNSKVVPWLAKSWKQASDATGIDFTIRDGVKWSDGKPFTAADVVYTIKLDQKVSGSFDYVSSVTASDDNTVSVKFSRPYSPGIYEIGAAPMLPEHVWTKIKDPAKYTNPNPVGTGPYTKVTNFQGQSFDLLKNPNYWQADKLQVPGIRMLAYSGLDAANAAAVNGDIDWSPQYVPNIEKTFIAKDPKNRGYWFPTVGGTIQFTLNDTKAPFNDVNVRKALSMAIDRDQIAKIGQGGYTKPSDCTGLSDISASWKDKSIVASCTWTKLDVDAANKLLDSSGYKKDANGNRLLKDGSPFTFSIIVNATSSDWVSDAQIITKNLAAVGVQAKVAAQDTNLLVQNLFTNNFDAAMAWSGVGATPYFYYRSQLSTERVNKDTNQATENFGRYNNPAAAALIAKFAATSNESEQRDLSDQLQAIFNKEAPAIPLFPSPVWGSYNAKYFTGWPSADNPYADLNPLSSTAVIVLTTLKKAN